VYQSGFEDKDLRTIFTNTELIVATLGAVHYGGQCHLPAEKKGLLQMKHNAAAPDESSI
jgi:hypothetical protein